LPDPDSAITTILAFDYGLRQIGVAVGNRPLGTSQALTVLKARDGVPNWEAVQALIVDWQPDLLVIGEPLNMDGSDSELAVRARRFARRLQGRLGIPTAMADERLSSFEAKALQAERGHRGDYKAQPVDSHAAELILQTWLRESATGGPDSG
jgi:putative Holliday junction resolvase